VMDRKWLRIILAPAIVTGIVAVQPCSAMSCNLKTLTGEYGFAATGFVPQQLKSGVTCPRKTQPDKTGVLS
jgi:hypothetical protein